jgi:hypothetical protein
MLVLDEMLRVRKANRAFRERFKVAKADLEHARADKVGGGWNAPKIKPWLL